MLQLSYLVFWSTLRFAGSLIVKVPSKPLFVNREGTASLPCEFTANQELSMLVITWQRTEDNRVVHSYYYQMDKLERQSSEYRNRTKLDYKQIAEGNATLEITNFGLKDAGSYLCVVANSLGSDRGVVRLNYVAYYSEPRLSIHRSATDITVQYETEGYPEPEVMWQNSDGQNLTDQQNISSAPDEGLYYLRSSFVTQNPAINITFFLKNLAVHQELQRHVVLNFGGNTSIDISTVTLSILCAVLACSTGVLLLLYCKKAKNSSK